MTTKRIVRHAVQWGGILTGIGSLFTTILPGWASAAILFVGGIATRIPALLDEKKDATGRPNTAYDPDLTKPL